MKGSFCKSFSSHIKPSQRIVVAFGFLSLLVSCDAFEESSTVERFDGIEDRFISTESWIGRELVHATARAHYRDGFAYIVGFLEPYISDLGELGDNTTLFYVTFRDANLGKIAQIDLTWVEIDESVAGADGIRGEFTGWSFSERIEMTPADFASADTISVGWSLETDDALKSWEDTPDGRLAVSLAEARRSNMTDEVRNLFEQARTLARLGFSEEAISLLQEATSLGLDNYGALESTVEFGVFENDDSFQEVTERVRESSRSCTNREEFHQFDFLVGSWRIEDLEGNHEADFVIEKSEDECVLRGWGVYPDGATRSMLGYLNPVTNVWNQMWISGGFLIEVSAQASESNLLRGTLSFKALQPEILMLELEHRAQPDGRIVEDMNASLDGGASWIDIGDVIWLPVSQP